MALTNNDGYFSFMKKWNSDHWISFVAIVASLGTLFTVVYQTNLYREQQYASVLPYLELWNSNSDDSYRLILVNNGIGPAFIDKVSIIYKDSTYQMDPAVFLANVIVLEDTINHVGHSNIGKGRLIPAGSKINLVQVTGNKENADKLRSWFTGNRNLRSEFPEIEIEYSSVYGEKWKILKYGSDQPIKLN